MAWTWDERLALGCSDHVIHFPPFFSHSLTNSPALLFGGGGGRRMLMFIRGWCNYLFISSWFNRNLYPLSGFPEKERG